MKTLSQIKDWLDTYALSENDALLVELILRGRGYNLAEISFDVHEKKFATYSDFFKWLNE